MKKWIIILSVFLLVSLAFAANIEIVNMTGRSSPTATDVMPLEDVSHGLWKISLGQLQTYIVPLQIPSVVGQTGLFLTNNGTTLQWQAVSGAYLSSSGTPANHQHAVFSDSQHIKGVVVNPFTIACTDTNGDPTSCPALQTGTSATLVGPRAFYVCTGTCTVTLPVPVAGYEFCVYNDDNVSTSITLHALGSSARYENSARTAYGTAGTGTLVVTAAAKDFVCVFGRDSTHYLTTSSNGTVTVN